MPRPGPGDRGSNEEQLSTVLRPSGELSSRRSAVLPPQARFSGHHAQNLIAVACAEDQRVWCSAPRSSRRSERAAQGRVSDWVTAPAPPLRLDELQLEHQLSPCALGSAQAHGDGRCTVSGAPGQDAKAQSAWRLGPCDCSAEGRLYSCNVFSGSEDLHVCISWSFGRLPPAVQLYIQVVTHCAWRRLVYRIAGAMLHFSTVLS